MLELVVHGAELFDESKGELIDVPETKLKLEHCLLAISKWESKWKKPFLSEKPHAVEESADYVRCMSMEDVDPMVFMFLTKEQSDAVQQYIKEPQTATFVNVKKTYGRKEIVTSELIYYWMTAQNIPLSCETWHLSRLMALIQIAGIKNNPKKRKMAKRDISQQYHDLNEKRLAELNTKG